MIQKSLRRWKTKASCVLKSNIIKWEKTLYYNCKKIISFAKIFRLFLKVKLMRCEGKCKKLLSDINGIRTHSHLVCSQTAQTIELCCEYLAVRYIWLHVIIMPHTRFRVNLHSIVAWISGNSLLETSAISEV